MVEATVARRNGGVDLTVGDQRLSLDGSDLEGKSALATYEGSTIVLGIRPEHLEDASLASDAPPEHRLRGTVVLREALGSELMVHFTVDGGRTAETEDVKELARDVGDDRSSLPADEDAIFVGRFGARARVKDGEQLEAAVDTSSLHFFDPETGLGVYDEQTKGATS